MKNTYQKADYRNKLLFSFSKRKLQLRIFSAFKLETQKTKETIANFKTRQTINKIQLAFKNLAIPKILKHRFFQKMSDAAAFWINSWLGEQIWITQKIGTKMELGDKINSKSFSSFSPLERGEVFILFFYSH